jgi:3-alpha domain
MAVSVAAMVAQILDRHPSPDALQRILRIPALAAVWRREFEARLGE